MSAMDTVRRFAMGIILLLVLLMWGATKTLSPETKKAMKSDLSRVLKSGISAVLQDEELPNTNSTEKNNILVANTTSVSNTTSVVIEKKKKMKAPARNMSVNPFPGITSEKIKSLSSKSSNIIVTFANREYADFASNWVRHLRQQSVTNYVVCAMDSTLYKYLTSTDKSDPLYVPANNVVELNAGLPTKGLGWGSKKFRRLGIMKVALAHTIVSFGIHVLILDVDAFPIRNPNVLLEKFQLHTDVLASTDALSRSEGDLEASMGGMFPHFFVLL